MSQWDGFNYKLLRDSVDEYVLPAVKKIDDLHGDKAYLCINRITGHGDFLYCREGMGRDKTKWIQEVNSRHWAMPNNNQAMARYDIYGPVDLSVEGIMRMLIAAQRWNALMDTARIRILGSANIRTERGESPVDYAHFGAEFWTMYDRDGRWKKEMAEGNAEGQNIITRFVDKMRRLLNRNPDTNKCGWCDESQADRECLCVLHKARREEKPC